LPFGVARLAGLRIQLPPDLSAENKKRFVFSEMPACRRRRRASQAPGSCIFLHKDNHHAASAPLLQIVSQRKTLERRVLRLGNTLLLQRIDKIGTLVSYLRRGLGASSLHRNISPQLGSNSRLALKHQGVGG
jgi:hypothetical protein